jgi:nucleoside-diphosphate-sugar epimerase
MTKGTICVLGCSGFVGSHVTAELLAQGFNVHGALRDTSTDKTAWIKEHIAPLSTDDATLTLFPFQAKDKESIKAAADGCSGIICCAGSPLQKPETIEIMEDLATNVSDAALELGIRSVTINPSIIAGPCFQPEPVTSLRSFAAIIKGERMSDKTPNSSMSMIDVRDLAKVHVAALVSGQASGRYFGVKKSWHWRDIVSALSEIVPEYAPPAIDPDEEAVTPTQFDLTRRDSLGVNLRDLPDILSDVVMELQERKMI